jgi:hypothetical protein
LRAIVSDHLITALHCAHGGFEYRTGLIAEALTRLEMRVFADDTFARDFLHFAVGIGGDPTTAKQARRDFAFVANGNGASKDVFIFFGFALIIVCILATRFVAVCVKH